MPKDACLLCRKEDDPSKNIISIMCQQCYQWYHQKCLKFTNFLAQNTQWTCESCENANANQETVKELKEKIEEMKAENLDVQERLKKAETKMSKTESSSGSSSGGGGDKEEEKFAGLLEFQKQLLSRQFLADLPEFNGDPADWPLFFCQYTESTRQGNLDDAFNTARLRKALKGAALNAVRGALSMPNNLKEVMKTLKKRFGNEENIIKGKLRIIESLQQPHEAKPSSIKAFFEALQDLKATMTNLGANRYLDSPQTLSNVVEKLHPSLKGKWFKHTLTLDQPLEVKLEEFIQWFEPMYDCAILMEEHKIETKKKEHVNVHSQGTSNTKNAESKKTSANIDMCACCKSKGHDITTCRQFKELSREDRLELLKRERACFCCLKGQHISTFCQQKKKCGIEGCKWLHHPLLHKDTKKKEKDDGDEKEGEKSFGGHHNKENEFSEVSYRVLPVKLSHRNKSIVTWAFLDEGSGSTLLSKEIAKSLEISGPRSTMCLSWTNGVTQTDKNSEVVELEISGADGGRKFHMQNVRTIEKLELPLPSEKLLKSLKDYKHLEGIKVPEIPIHTPGILIGLRHSKLCLSYEVREGKWDQPVATLTRLGWAVYGNTGRKSSQNSLTAVCRVCECPSLDENLNETVKKFFTTESFGVRVVEKSVESREIEKAREIFQNTIRKVDERYEVGLLWRDNTIELPNNYGMAFKRLTCFENRLGRDPILKSAVLEKLESHEKKGYIRKVSPTELQQHQGRKWYLPMFATSNPNKPGKIRLVYDAAASCNGLSLNDALITGPDLLASLFGILLRFRLDIVALSADVAEMFHQVRIIQQDQFCQLLLWRNCETNKPVETWMLCVMAFGPKCSPSSSQEVKNVNALQFREKYPEAVKDIIENTYVDDLLSTVNNASTAIQRARQIIEIYAAGGFEIRNWISNSHEVRKALNPSKENAENVSMDLNGENSVEKVLGMFWDVSTDKFIFKLNFNRVDKRLITGEMVPTKREMLRVVMSIFDPIGVMVPLVIPAKVLLQKLWRQGIGWDERITPELTNEWRNWLKGIQDVANYSIPRCYSPNLLASDEIELHVFADAGENAFCATAFLRFRTPSDTFEIAFVSGKSKVAPQKALSIPRLELQGAVMASRLATSIKKELNLQISKTHFWTDSRTVVGWIRSDHRRYSPFVAHRVSEILDSTTIEQWRWVPSKDNVADDGTKWDDIPVISERWLKGPSFLLEEEHKWPMERKKVQTTEEELKIAHYMALPNDNPYDWLAAEDFSSWIHLQKAVVYGKRYVKQLLDRIRDPNRTKLHCERKDPKLGKYHLSKKAKEGLLKYIKEKPVNGPEMQPVEEFLIKKCQHESFYEEIKILKRKKNIPRHSEIFNLIPFLDEKDMLRADTRLDAVPLELCDEAKKPLILGKSHIITFLIIRAFHVKMRHYGRELVVREVRRRFWVPKIRVQVNKVIRRCNLCNFHRARTVIPRMSALPPARLAINQPAFTNTMMDFFGPMLVTIGRRREKRYGVVFVCMTMRAVHIELASSLNTSSCIMAVRNFINRRGAVKQIWSDNGTNLRGAESELKEAIEAIDKAELMSQTQPNTPNYTYIEWKFSPPSAPHFNGAVERMVGLIKRPLYQILKSRAPPEETLRSLLIEIENIINSRPLNYTSNSDGDPEPAITPNHFLRLNDRPVMAPGNYQVTKWDNQWRICQEMTTEYWYKFLHDYIPNIGTRSKWYDENKPINVGQLVLVIDDTVKRNQWRRGVIKAVHPGKDGRIRTATVKMESTTLPRPVAKLAIINISENSGFV